jgi:hypothetical protein
MTTEFRLRIEPDNDSESPREWDNLGTMVCFHNRYNLGDKHNHSADSWREDILGNYLDLEEFDDYWSNNGWSKLRLTLSYVEACEYIAELREERLSKAFLAQFICLPLYLYDHSGITMNTTGFSCGWDSGQVGFIYVSIADVKKEYNWKNLNKARREKIINYLKGEVETYDQYLTGDVYGYCIDSVEVDEYGDETVIEESVESCWGYFGSKYAEEEGKSMLKWAIENAAIQAEKKIFPVATMGV